MPGQESGHVPKKKRRVWKLVLLLVVIVVLAAAGRYAYVMFYDPMSAFNKPTPAANTPAAETPAAAAVPEETAAPEPAAAPTPSPTLSPEDELEAQADLSFMKNKVNILMLGWDQSPEREDEDSALYRDAKNNYRSDVIMLLSVDFEKKTVDLISVPRDTYAPIYNTKGRWKINAAFAKGGSAEGRGFEYAIKTVENLLGVPIEYYAGVDMVGLKAIVDAMGGVDYDVDVETHLNGRVLYKGMQHMDGQQVLDYVRARKGISTDVGRNDRQQRMLFAVFQQLKSRNQLVNIPKIYASVQDKVKTNLNSEQIAALSVFAMDLDPGHISRHTLEGEYISDVYNASFYVLYNSKLQALVKDIFGIRIKTNPRYDVGYVRADKAAQSALAYADGAQYLLGARVNGLPPDRETALPLENAVEALLAVAQRSIPADASDDTVEKLTASSLDKSAIENAQIDVANAMYAYCVKLGITQADADKRTLPVGFYELLPAAGSAYNGPALTPAPTLPPDTDPEGID